MRKAKRMLAVLLAGTMVMGTGLTAFAADDKKGSTTGTGEFEGHVEKSVLLVQLPTVSTEAEAVNPFNYTMDPEGLIAATEGAKNKDATFETGANVYFLSAPNTYTKDSKKLKVVNKGTTDADVTVEAETIANSDITMVAGKDAFLAAPTDDDTGAQLYLGLVVADKETVAIYATGDTENDKASVSVGLKGNNKNYEVKYDEASKKYSYEAKADVPDTAWNSFEFGLTGACNEKGDYSTANLTAANVTVTWSYAEHDAENGPDMLTENATEDAAPSIQAEPYDYDRTAALEINVNFGAGTQKATSIQKVDASNDGTAVTADFTSVCTIAGNKITFASGQFGGASVGDTRYLIVTFDNGKKARATLNITK